ncbi:MAG: helix-turn-helix domain-containing protein [Ruminococcaceae bacterium]|nr:helix-turn-helix domain-containing protein [Oscillospiraceae bacterium]
MADENLKYQIGTNIALLRKKQGLTQAGLAEKLNYSDKAVSKWERGESVPDVLTLVSIAQELDVSVDVLLTDPNALPEHTGPVQNVMNQVVQKTLKRKADKRIIVWLSSILVWFVALLTYVVLSSLGIAKSWLAFFAAVPADAIVRLSLRSAWHDFRSNRTLISVLMWSSLLCVYMVLFAFLNIHLWKIFLLGIPGQVSIILWFRMFRTVSGAEVKNGQSDDKKADS